MELEPGQRIGDYEIVARLGAGGLGVVYEVRHLISQRHEAMKIMQSGQSAAPKMGERFLREVQTLAALNHANIAALHTAFYHHDQLVMIMELVRGETLRDLRLKTTITLSHALDFVTQVLQALIYAHQLGVVHRDIKPQNIMVTTESFIKLLDFGLALTDHSSDLTQSGHLLGSISYMSPEQVSGGKATPQSDIYSLGVTFYELLTGRLPITGATAYEILTGHLQKVPMPPHALDPLIPVSLSDIVMCTLAKDPAQRFSSARELLDAVRMGPTIHMPATARPLSPAQSVQRKTPSHSASQPVPLEDITRSLAVYIGPVAKLVVKKLAEQFDDTDSIYREAARQIPSHSDRAAFLRSKKH
ncbi:MAG TPA: serine/threonine-protein kinase [Acidobacteriaceae bacterium]|nr:serine/threonine-protein kinase [Acidobacteriaceae bacterium]